MKAKKSRVILSGVSLLLVLCLLVGGTMAWFTDTEKVATNFSAGILDVSVKPGEEGQTALDFKNLRPMLYENFYNELDKNEWNNDVTQGGTTGLKDSHYEPVPAYFKPVEITNEGTLPTKVKLSLEAGNGCADGEPILTKDNITITQDGSKQDCANRLAPVLKVFVYKLVGEDWTLVEGVNLNTAYDEDAANPDGVASENTAEEANSTYMTAMIPANGTERYVIAGYLPETVGNAYQGQHYHGNLVLNAYQMDDTAAGNPDEGGSSSEDPDDPDRFEDNVTIEWRENTADGTLVQSRKVTVKSDTTIAAADYDAPQGYVYSPAAADQSSAVTVDDETGAATPATVVFTVVEEEAETIDYVLHYQNTVNGELLAETETVQLEVPGEYTIATPDWAGRTVTITAPLPEGYVFDPAVQSFNVSVDAEGVATPETVTFKVKKPLSVGVVVAVDLTDYFNETTVPNDGLKLTETVTITKDNFKTLLGLNNYELYPETQSQTITVAEGKATPATISLTVRKVDTEGKTVLNMADGIDNIRLAMDMDFVLENNISMAKFGSTFKPIGWTDASDVTFTGSLDGKGNEISQLGADWAPNNTTDNTNVGLFALNGGTIENLKISTAGLGVLGGRDVGIVAGQNTGVISNVHTSGYVGAIYRGSGSNDAGGITGLNRGTVQYCSSDVSAYGYTYIGGLVGKNYNKIDQSYTFVEINAEVSDSDILNSSKVYCYLGGIAGGNVGTVSDCYVIQSGNIRGEESVGGMLGTNGGTLENCFIDQQSYYLTANRNVHDYVGATQGTRSNLYIMNNTDGDPDGITSGEVLTGFDTSVWSFTAGEYPDLMNNRR